MSDIEERHAAMGGKDKWSGTEELFSDFQDAHIDRATLLSMLDEATRFPSRWHMPRCNGQGWREHADDTCDCDRPRLRRLRTAGALSGDPPPRPTEDGMPEYEPGGNR